MEQIYNDQTDSEPNIQYIAQQLSELCTEFVDISAQLEEIAKSRKGMAARQKELSTRITALMNSSDIDEVNCGTKAKIIKSDRKSTTSLKINDIENIIATKFNIDSSTKEAMVEHIKNSRVTSVKPTIKIKKL